MDNVYSCYIEHCTCLHMYNEIKTIKVVERGDGNLTRGAAGGDGLVSYVQVLGFVPQVYVM